MEARFGRGFGEKSLRHMVRFAEAFPDAEIVSAARRQLSWSHFRQLASVDDPLAREFYTEMSRAEGWSTRIPRRVIQRMALPDELLAVRHDPERPDQSEVAYRIAWARSWLKKAGLVDNPKRGA